jgi:hypothetical protein
VLLPAAFSLLVTAAPLQVEGDVSCPAPAEVAARLRPLLGGAGVGQPGDRVRLDREAGVLRVALVRADGQVRGARNVDERHDCAELAEAAAVILASWQAAEAPPLRAPAAAARLTSPGPVARLQAEGAATTPNPPDGTAPASVDLHLGGAATFAGDGARAGVSLAGTFGGIAGGLGLRLGARYDGFHRVVVRGSKSTGDAGVRWRRLPLTLGPAFRVAASAMVVEGHLALAAAWLTLAGEGFANDQRNDVLDVGTSAGLRLIVPGLTSARLCPYLGVEGAYWPRKTVANELSNQGSAALPRSELAAVLGLAFRL